MNLDKLQGFQNFCFDTTTDFGPCGLDKLQGKAETPFRNAVHPSENDDGYSGRTLAGVLVDSVFGAFNAQYSKS